MGCVLYCIGNCKQIMIGFRPIVDGNQSDMDEGSATGCFICDDCAKNGSVNPKHPFASLSISEADIRKDTVYIWSKEPIQRVLPEKT